MPNQSRDQFLDLPEGDPLSTERIDERVQQAEQQEQILKRQLETIEKQRRELEELSRRQDALNTGRTDVVDKLTRALVVLERESLDANKRIETLHSISSSFAQHLEIVESINPKSWDGADMGKELTRAIAAVDDARAEYAKSVPKISAPDEQSGGGSHEQSYAGDSTGGDGKDFLGWLKIGFAFSLPLIIFGLITIVIIISHLPSK